MIGTRIIPCLLLRDGGLVKTKRFGEARYVGDPINAVKIFNEKECHELVFLDIDATKNKRPPSFDVVERIAGECFMPLAYGGGIRDIESIRRLLSLGVEKVVINSYAAECPDFVQEASDAFGSSTIVVSIDVKRSFFGGYDVVTHGGTRKTKCDPVSYAVRMASLGAGELIVNSVDRDGMMQGYDIPLIKSVAEAVEVPVVALGGAASCSDLAAVVLQGGASAAAAGSMFVFYGKLHAVLINYPEDEDLIREGLGE